MILKTTLAAALVLLAFLPHSALAWLDNRARHRPPSGAVA